MGSDHSNIRKIKLIPFTDLFVTKHFYGALMGENLQPLTESFTATRGLSFP